MSTHNSGATWEDTKLTLTLMIQHGLNNVRGAEYCQIADFTLGDCKRMAYAACHHLGRTDLKHIEDGFKRDCQYSEAPSAPFSSGPNNQIIRTASVISTTASPPAQIGRTLSGIKRNHEDSIAVPSLYNDLSNFRNYVAQNENVHSFMVFNNETLDELCTNTPRNKQELLDIRGIGPKKAELYGYDILSIIRRYTNKSDTEQRCIDCSIEIPLDPLKPRCYACYKKGLGR